MTIEIKTFNNILNQNIKHLVEHQFCSSEKQAKYFIIEILNSTSQFRTKVEHLANNLQQGLQYRGSYLKKIYKVLRLIQNIFNSFYKNYEEVKHKLHYLQHSQDIFLSLNNKKLTIK